MVIFLSIWSTLWMLVGVYVLISSRGPVDSIGSLVSFLIATVSIIGAALIEAVDQSRKSAEAVKQRRAA
jgi:hypothetical protein